MLESPAWRCRRSCDQLDSSARCRTGRPTSSAADPGAFRPGARESRAVHGVGSAGGCGYAALAALLRRRDRLRAASLPASRYDCARLAEAEHQRVMLTEHRPPRGHRRAARSASRRGRPSSLLCPELTDYVGGLKQRSRKAVTLALRQLLRLVREYPREPLLGAVQRGLAGMVFTIWTSWNG